MKEFTEEELVQYNGKNGARAKWTIEARMQSLLIVLGN